MKELKFKGLKNIRDLGGLHTADGQRVRHHLFYRSDALDRLTPEDCRTLTDDCHVATVIDLRTDMEAAERPNVAIQGVEYLHIPLFCESVIGITHETGADTGAYVRRTHSHKAIRAAIPDMTEIYSYVMTDAAIVSQMSCVLKTIIDNALSGRTTLFHCTQGKDRTGAVAALLLRLLGVDEDTVYHDYMLTNRVVRAKALKDFILVVLFKLDVVAARKVWRAYTADKAYLKASFDTIERLYGTFADFFRTQLGISDTLRLNFCRIALAR